jgi:predicted nucleotide-binding protein
MSDKPQVFISYARADFEPVRRIVEELNASGVDTWADFVDLEPGTFWEKAIDDAIRRCDAFVFFMSPESLRRKWIVHELEAAIDNRSIRIIPVLLYPTLVSELPPSLAAIQWVDISLYPPESAAKKAAAEIARAVLRPGSTTSPAELPDRQRKNLAAAFAAQVRDQPEQPKKPDEKSQQDEKSPHSIFIVHGHDEEFLREVQAFLIHAGIKPIVMKDADGASVSLFQEFFKVGRAADFAIVLLSGDDMGASRIQYERPEAGVHALKYRTRQNVTLELGYFYGLLGWENVFVLEKDPPKPYPDFERPSDLNGVRWDRYDKNGRWRKELYRRLAERGFKFAAASA